MNFIFVKASPVTTVQPTTASRSFPDQSEYIVMSYLLIVSLLFLVLLEVFKIELLKQTSSFPEFYSYKVQWNSVNTGDRIKRVSVESGSTVPKSLILILNLTGYRSGNIKYWFLFWNWCFGLSLNSDLRKTNISFSKDLQSK